MTTQKIRVLYFVDFFQCGGIQTLLWNVAKEIDRDKFDVEFLTLDDGVRYPMEDDLKGLGYPVHILHGIWLNTPMDFMRERHALQEFYAENEPYDIVHMHSTSKNFLVLKEAERHGVNVRIAHSHNTGYMTQNKAKVLFGDLLKPSLIHHANYHFACSVAAGKWMFGSTFEPGVNGYVLNNAIRAQDYRFDINKRIAIRHDLGLSSDADVVIDVGRLEPVKNHSFLIRTFAALHQADPSAVLLLAGDGALKSKLQQEAHELKVADSVKFLGLRNDVAELLQAADVFVMPSIHEGLPFVAIEAQAAGLPCVFSDGITREAGVLPSSVFYSLGNSPEAWAQKVLGVMRSSERHDTYSEMVSAGYDLKTEMQKLEVFYESAVEKTRDDNLRLRK